MASRIKEHVFIIESPSSDDLLQDRREGYALSSALRLADISSSYHLAVTQDAFTKVLESISQTPASIKRVLRSPSDPSQQGIVLEDSVIMPLIHLSLHGNDSGIALSSGEFILWEQLGDALYKINDRIGWG